MSSNAERRAPLSAEAWIHALQHRHRAAFTSAEFLKAVRALSARYVERRSSMRGGPLDSAGKRAAFGAFYAPLHFLTAREIVRRQPPPAPLHRIVDLGCGTGAVSAACALEQAGRPRVTGVDVHPWVLDEAMWNWRQLGVDGAAQRGDLVRATERLQSHARAAEIAATGVVSGWSANELSHEALARLLPALIDLGRRGAYVLVIEPLAKSAVPWWREWADAFAGAGGRADEWRIGDALPPVMQELSDAAGFRRDALTARTLTLAGQAPL
jgi:hypothetical protein